MSVSGQWKLCIHAPTGVEQTVLDLDDSAAALTGSQTGRGETSEISEASYDGTHIAWVNKIKKPMKIKAKFSGTVEGDQMRGKVKVGIMPAMPFTATRC